MNLLQFVKTLPRDQRPLKYGEKYNFIISFFFTNLLNGTWAGCR